MAQFMFIFRGGGYTTPDRLSPTEIQQHLARWNAWTSSLLEAGKLAGAHALAYPASGKTLRGRDRTVTDGPYAESKDLVSGAMLINADSLAAAAELARDCPIFEHDGSVEVRPVLVRPSE